MNSEALHKALRALEIKGVVDALSGDDLSSGVVARKFLRAIRESSCFVIPIQDAKAEKHRDQLVLRCRELIAPCQDPGAKMDFENHVEDSRHAEFGFREIFRTLQTSKIWSRPPAEQAWGVILRSKHQFSFLQEAIESEMRKLGRGATASIDPRQFTVVDADGARVKPDVATTGFTKNVGDALITMAYVHRWFEKGTGAVIIPAKVDIDDETTFEAGNFELAAAQWRRLEHSWDRSRLFRARFRIRKQEFPVKGGGVRECSVLESSSAEALERYDRISSQRVQQAFFEVQKDMEGSERQAVASPKPVPLAKAGYISPDERAAVRVLDGLFHLPIDDNSVEIEGISFKAWLRGYAFYAQLATNPNGTLIMECVQLREPQLLAGLQSAGLSPAQASAFFDLQRLVEEFQICSTRL